MGAQMDVEVPQLRRCSTTLEFSGSSTTFNYMLEFNYVDVEVEAGAALGDGGPGQVIGLWSKQRHQGMKGRETLTHSNALLFMGYGMVM